MGLYQGPMGMRTSSGHGLGLVLALIRVWGLEAFRAQRMLFELLFNSNPHIAAAYYNQALFWTELRNFD